MIRPSALHPTTVSALAATIAAASLGFALTSQYGFGLHPCELCIWQRWPFGIVIGLGIIGFFWARTAMPMIALSGLAFFINAGIGVFHSGVERKWWAGLQGCSAPDLSGSIEDLMERIQSAAVTRCDEMGPSLFGLTMANYNAAMCAGLALACGLYLYLRLRKPV